MVFQQRGSLLPLRFHFCFPLPWEATTFLRPFFCEMPSDAAFLPLAAAAKHGASFSGFQESQPGNGQLTCKPSEPARCLATAANVGKAVHGVELLPVWLSLFGQ